MNSKREQTRSFDRALRDYGNVSPTEAMTDFIADAMHYCRNMQVDFDQIPATATMHFDAECIPVAFDDYEVSGVREYGNGTDRFCERVTDDDAQFWSLYGHIPGQGAECIGDFKSRAVAEEVYARITGRRYGQQVQIDRDAP